MTIHDKLNSGDVRLLAEAILEILGAGPFGERTNEYWAQDDLGRWVFDGDKSLPIRVGKYHTCWTEQRWTSNPPLPHSLVWAGESADAADREVHIYVDTTVDEDTANPMGYAVTATIKEGNAACTKSWPEKV